MTDSSEDVITKDVFEKMKMRFRKEALVAVEEAEKRGFENGRQETKDSSGDEVQLWKSVAEAVTNARENPNPVLLLKLSMEQVYKDLRREFAEESDIIDRFKVSAAQFRIWYSFNFYFVLESAYLQ